MTSFQAVGIVRRISGIRKVGHAGTLDPLATGLLIICTGKMTKQIQYIQVGEKEYLVEFVLGATTISVDLEQEPENFKDISHITSDDIEAALVKFRGSIEQVPPIFSAVKINGVRAYKLAREGANPEMKVRQVEVREFDLLNYQDGIGTARICCGKGTYVRSLIRDLGEELGVGAYMKNLSRTRIGEHELSKAWDLDELDLAVNGPKKEGKEGE